MGLTGLVPGEDDELERTVLRLSGLPLLPGLRPSPARVAGALA